MLSKLTISLFAVILILPLLSCDKAVNQDGTGTLIIKLTDAPFPLDTVSNAEVVIDSIEIRRMDTDDQERPYILLTGVDQTYNLIELQNGLTVDLVNMDVDAGDYDLIRLYVKSARIVLKDPGHTSFDLKIPSGEQTGIKVFISPYLRVVDGLTSELLLDFDVRRSFVPQGSSKDFSDIKGFHFKPVIRAVNVSTVGSIGGTVKDKSDNQLEGVLISLEQNGEELIPDAYTGSHPDSPGRYLIPGLTPGLYTVIASKDGYVTKDSSDVEVFVGNQSQVNFILEESTP